MRHFLDSHEDRCNLPDYVKRSHVKDSRGASFFLSLFLFFFPPFLSFFREKGEISRENVVTCFASTSFHRAWRPIPDPKWTISLYQWIFSELDTYIHTHPSQLGFIPISTLYANAIDSSLIAHAEQTVNRPTADLTFNRRHVCHNCFQRL